MLPATSVRFFYYFKGKQRTAFVAGSIHMPEGIVSGLGNIETNKLMLFIIQAAKCMSETTLRGGGGFRQKKRSD
jgi:hypothetical protein